MPTISGSSVWADLNGWRVQTNVWNAGGLVYGQDYTIAATYSASNFANHPQYAWSFPALTQNNYYNVHAYPEIMFGGSPWWGGALSSDPLQIFPIRVSDLTELTLKYDLAATGDSQGYNVAFELFLTNQPNGNSSTITNEVMVWFHRGAFIPGGSATGTYLDTNFTGTVYNAFNWNAGTGAPGWTYTAFLSSTDDLSGQIDIAAMLRQLQTMGIVSGNNYIAGLELGAEVATGQGSLTVNSLEYDVQANNGLNTILGASSGTANADRIIGSADGDTLNGLGGADLLYGFAGNDTLNGGNDQDTLIGGAGNDTLDGGSNIDTAVVAGSRSAFTITQTSTGNFTVSGPDGTDTLTNVEYLKFDDQTIRLLPGTGSTVTWSADPSTYMAAIRDFDGNDLGGASGWKLIGTADVNGDGRAEHILFNRQIGRWAEVGTEADGLTYFANYNWAGDTRVVGIYIDPLVANGTVVKNSDTDSQRRFQNDLMIDNIHGVLGQADYNHDGLQEAYFSLMDGTAYLHAYMHADGNIQYANYQSKQQVIDYLTNNGFTSSTWSSWFPSSQVAMEAPLSDPLDAAGSTGTVGIAPGMQTTLWSLAN